MLSAADSTTRKPCRLLRSRSVATKKDHLTHPLAASTEAVTAILTAYGFCRTKGDGRNIMPQRRIFSQGDFDGACLLYALANAYTALTGHAPGCAAWDKGIAALPSARAFLQGCVGTSRACYRSQELQEQVLTSMLGCFSESGSAVHAEWLPDCREVASAAERVARDAVVVFRYHGKTAQVITDDHWVCGVAVTGGPPLRLHLACSFRHSQDSRLNAQRYGERFFRGVGRYANDWVTPEHEIVIIPGSVYLVQRTGPHQEP